MLIRNSGRPERVNQWNISLQREVVRDIVVEAAYVGNRGVWIPTGGGQGFTDSTVNNLLSYNAVSPAVLARYGLGDLTNANTRALLNSTISSAAAIAAGFTRPICGLSRPPVRCCRVCGLIRSTAASVQYQAPVGKSWYDSLQTKMTKRFSHGLTATATYTFSKTLDSTTNAGSIYDRGSFKGLAVNDYPNMFTMSIDYTVPAFGIVKRHGIARLLLSDWRITTIDTFQSGNAAGLPDLEQLDRQLSLDRLHQNGSRPGPASLSG